MRRVRPYLLFGLAVVIGGVLHVLEVAVEHSRTLRARSVRVVVEGVADGNYFAYVHARRWRPYLSRKERAAIDANSAAYLSANQELHWSEAPWHSESRLDRLARLVMKLSGYPDDPIRFRKVCVPAFQRIPLKIFQLERGR